MTGNSLALSLTGLKKEILEKNPKEEGNRKALGLDAWSLDKVEGLGQEATYQTQSG